MQEDKMISEIRTLTFQGIEIIDVTVQAHISSGMPAFTLVGLADKTIAESKERVKAALQSIGLALPQKKILISLAPADIVKEGSHFDLAIAICLLSVMGVIPISSVKEYMILGELSLDGGVKQVSGVLPAAVGATARGLGLICPLENIEEASWSGNENIIPVDNLLSIINHFKEVQIIASPNPNKIKSITRKKYTDIADIRGLENAKRALIIAAAGGHNMIMSGPPGAGKSMLASCMPGILPELSAKEMLEISMIYSVAGLLKDGQLTAERPFRAPHHSCSMPAMVGGGIAKRVSPGEISLAHNGVLFLDELPEFPKTVIDALRQPLETHNVLISRSGAHVNFPARFQLIAAMNPCRCGYISDSSRSCNKAPKCAMDYQAKISGPIMDRFDIHVEVTATIPGYNYKESSFNSKQVAEQIVLTRQIQATRWLHLNIYTNSEIPSNLIDNDDFMTKDARDLLNEACEKLRLSMRGYYRVARVARTIADLEQMQHVEKQHIAESVSYRQYNI
jgi:magnesium chelatase family protein